MPRLPVLVSPGASSHAPHCPEPPPAPLVAAVPDAAPLGSWRWLLVALRCPGCGALTARTVDTRAPEETP